MILLSSDQFGLVVSDDDGVKTLKPDEKVVIGFYVYPNDREEYVETEMTRKELINMAVGEGQK